MKTNRLVLMAATLLTAGFAQAQTNENVVGLQWNESNTLLNLVTLNPENPGELEVQAQVNLAQDKRYMPNTMTHVEENNTLYFFTQSNASLLHGFTQGQQLEIANAQTGEILRSLPFLNTTLIAPFIIPDKDQIGFIATERTFNSYGNNDDNVALVIFNMNSGEIAHRIELPSLSLSATATPFVGTSHSKTPNGNINFTEVSVSVSTPCYVSSTQTLLFAAKDVMGINRLYRFDVNAGKLISKFTLDIDVLDMTYDESNQSLKTLYIENTDGERELKIGDMSLYSNVISNSTLLRTIEKSEENITDGEIEMDQNSGVITVVKSNVNSQVFYNYDADLSLMGTTTITSSTQNSKVDIEFPTPITSQNRIEFENLVKLYPNPAVESVTIETEDVSTVTKITVFDNVGQEVKDVDVQSGLKSNTIDVSNLKSGIYLVEIQFSGVSTVTKKLVVQ